MAPRFDDWPERLDAHMMAATGKVFTWGEHDCLTFCVSWVKAATGRDLVAEHGDIDWKDAITAARRMKSKGHDNIISLGRELFGREVYPQTIRRGDIAVTAQNTFGICIGRGVAAIKSGGGLMTFALDECLTGFEV